MGKTVYRVRVTCLDGQKPIVDLKVALQSSKGCIVSHGTTNLLGYADLHLTESGCYQVRAVSSYLYTPFKQNRWMYFDPEESYDITFVFNKVVNPYSRKESTALVQRVEKAELILVQSKPVIEATYTIEDFQSCTLDTSKLFCLPYYKHNLSDTSSSSHT